MPREKQGPKVDFRSLRRLTPRAYYNPDSYFPLRLQTPIADSNCSDCPEVLPAKEVFIQLLAYLSHK